MDSTIQLFIIIYNFKMHERFMYKTNCLKVIFHVLMHVAIVIYYEKLYIQKHCNIAPQENRP